MAIVTLTYALNGETVANFWLRKALALGYSSTIIDASGATISNPETTTAFAIRRTKEMDNEYQRQGAKILAAATYDEQKETAVETALSALHPIT